MYSTRLLLLFCLVLSMLYLVSASDQAQGLRRKRDDRYSQKNRYIRARYNSRKSRTSSTKTTVTKSVTTTTRAVSITSKATKSVTTTTRAVSTTSKATTTVTTTTRAVSTTSKATTTTKAATTTSSSSGATYTGDATYYTPGLGSCGGTNSDTDLIVALNAAQMANGANSNNNPKCGQSLTVTGPNGSVTVKIVDTCPSCASGDVDLSPAAFQRIALLSAGRVKVSWVFN